MSKLLEARGHTVIPFAMRYKQNLPSSYEKYFTPPPVDENLVLYEDRPMAANEKLRLLARSIHNPRAVADAREVIRAEKIDLVYTLQIAHFLHPAVLLAAQRENVPVVSRLSDFYLLAPCYTLFRDGPCEKCLDGPMPAFTRRCLKNSLPVTVARIVSMEVQHLWGVDRKVKYFLAPTKLMQDKMIEGGFLKNQVAHLPTFASFPEELPAAINREDYFLFAGNVFPHKGLAYLLDAVEHLPGVRLVVAGNCDTAEGATLQNRVKQKPLAGRVEFLGMVDHQKLTELYRKARAVVIPSIWYENLPNVMIEAISNGAPIIASDIGSLTETITDVDTGLTFDPRNIEEAVNALKWCVENPEAMMQMAAVAFDKAKRRFSTDRHMDNLEKILDSALRGTSLFADQPVSRD